MSAHDQSPHPETTPTRPGPVPPTPSTGSDAAAYAATRLAAEGIWVRRDYWVDEDGLEVDPDDPRACNADYALEVNYQRIVDRVLTHIEDFHTHHAAPPATAGHDWIGDHTLSVAQRRRQFDSLGPEPTRGPHEERP